MDNFQYLILSVLDFSVNLQMFPILIVFKNNATWVVELIYAA